MKQEIIADLSRITGEEQAILDGKTEVEKERYSSGQKFVMDAGKLLERGKLIDIRPHTRFIRFPAHSHNYVEMIYMCQGSTVHTINGDRIDKSVVILRSDVLLFHLKGQCDIPYHAVYEAYF